MGISPFASNAAKLRTDREVDAAKGVSLGAESWYLALRISIGFLKHFAHKNWLAEKLEEIPTDTCLAPFCVLRGKNFA